MYQVLRKVKQKPYISTHYLITDYRLLIATLALALSGCMGVYEGGFECLPGEGVKCKSISEVNEMVDQGLGVRNQVTEKKLLGEGIEHSCSVKDSSDFCSHETPEIWYAPWVHKERVSRGYPMSGYPIGESI
ncbi:MAG: hypothetical protein BGO67_08515 [Alphaproteobacteria bacterium 41-28]|nr:MAG: hypothetical protein BGO67_08515 [Alphaproteobacteria bacterium 41-28]